MAIKTFHLNEEPHTIVVGGYTFLFTPEAGGAEFASAYSALSTAQTAAKNSAAAEGEAVSAEALADVSAALRAFVREFMLPQTVDAFDGVKLPDRVLMGMVEFLAETYAGGNDPGTSSDGS